MRFTVENRIFELFPGLRLVVAVADGIDNRQPIPRLEERWRHTWVQAGRSGGAHGNAQSHPRVRPWRESMRAIGVSGQKFPSSIEAVLRRALKGGDPFLLNPMVDFYNLVSLSQVVPSGGFDLDGLDGELWLRLTREGDVFTALDDSSAVSVDPGEVAYACGSTVLTRHFVWRQSRTGLITPSTERVFLVSEILGQLDDAIAADLLEAFSAGLAGYFGAEPSVVLVHADAPTLSF
jgi:DNA/RNA-binding domain of Phe-tRNA-synthetase-like protein